MDKKSGGTDGRTDEAATICSPFGEKNLLLFIRIEHIMFLLKPKKKLCDNNSKNKRLYIYKFIFTQMSSCVFHISVYIIVNKVWYKK
jgi:hypothetical protein